MNGDAMNGDDLITWLRELFSDEKRDASARHVVACTIRDPMDDDPDIDYTDPSNCSCPQRERLLDIEAKQRIVDNWTWARRDADRSGHADRVAAALFQMRQLAYDSAVRSVASAYQDRAGYRQEWRP